MEERRHLEDGESIGSRLQIVTECELLTDSQLFTAYSHVWKNPHWYMNSTSMDGSSVSIHPHYNEIQNVRYIQNSLINYSLEFQHPPPSWSNSDVNAPSRRSTDTEFTRSAPSSTTAPILSTSKQNFIQERAIPLVDICSRLIIAGSQALNFGEPISLQAVIETKQVFGFFSITEICLMRSPRALRSLFGHSHSTDPFVNLCTEDFQRLSDANANFPGCVYWLNVIQQGQLSDRSRRIFNKMKEFIIFEGQDEVGPFLLLLREIFIEQQKQRVLQDNSTDRELIESGFDVNGLKHILANFPFRNAVIQVPRLIVNTPVAGKNWLLKWQCALVPQSQQQFYYGVKQLASSATANVRFTVSSSTLDAWMPIPCDIPFNYVDYFGFPQHILHMIPEALAWVKVHGCSTRDTSFRAQHPSNVLCADPSSSTDPNTLHPLVCIPTKAAHAHNNDSTNAVLVSCNTNVQLETAQRASRRSVGRAPSLVSRLKRQRVMPQSNTGALVCRKSPTASLNTTSSRSRSTSCLDQLWSYLPFQYRKALMCVNDQIIVFVGPFPFSSSTISIPFTYFFHADSDLLRYITYIIVSSTITVKELQQLQTTTECSSKIRTLFWFMHLLQESVNKTVVHSNTSSYAFTDINSNIPHANNRVLYEQILPQFMLTSAISEKSSRNAFFWVTDVVVADLISPLTFDPQHHILLSISSHALRARLWQMAEKQRVWETRTLKKLAESPESELPSIKLRLLSGCPSFLVHLLFILPLTCSDLHAPQNHHVISMLQKHTKAAHALQKEFPFRSPRAEILGEQSQNATGSNASRLLVWYLPLDFVKEAYMIPHRHQLVELLRKFHNIVFPLMFLHDASPEPILSTLLSSSVSSLSFSS